MSLYEMRRSYTLGTLLEKDIEADPMVQFRKWLAEAGEGPPPEWLEINAMTLSTCTPGGAVSSRIVLLKGLEEDKFWFYSNYTSRKAEEMEQSPQVSLCFLWPHLQRQVRIEGTVAKAPRDASERYFGSRPRASQLGAVVSNQSSVIPNREILEARLRELQTRYAESEIPCPETWGGYCVSPSSIEFWQGRESRLHDRIVYESDGGQWKTRRLAP
ncbi:MAG: pyridoxamine 5'-phosphate oxidase [Planctomycetota bacterium]